MKIIAPRKCGAFGNFAAKRSKTHANVINRHWRCHARLQCDRHDHDDARRNVLKIKKKLAKRKSKPRLMQAALSHVARGSGHATEA